MGLYRLEINRTMLFDHDALEAHIIASDRSASSVGGADDDGSQQKNGEEEEDMLSSLPVWLIYGASATEAGTTITGATKLQSSLQTGVSIELQWPARQTSDESNHVSANSETLTVMAKVGVDVSVSLPLSHDVSSVLNFYPIRTILNQAGGLIAILPHQHQSRHRRDDRGEKAGAGGASRGREVNTRAAGARRPPPKRGSSSRVWRHSDECT